MLTTEEEKEQCDTDDLCQDAHHTAMNHYPEIFENALANSSGPVLSFGCSTGEEVRSLKSLTNRPVHGVEACKDRLMISREADPDGLYVRTPEELRISSYGLVFIMSVLCRYPGAPESFSFERFQHWIERIDSLLAPGALLILWNANYDFRQTHTYEQSYNMEPFPLQHGGKGFDIECPDGNPGSGFLPKFTRDHTALSPTASREVPLAFRKKFSTEKPPASTLCATPDSSSDLTTCTVIREGVR